MRVDKHNNIVLNKNKLLSVTGKLNNLKKRYGKKYPAGEKDV